MNYIKKIMLQIILSTLIALATVACALNVADDDDDESVDDPTSTIDDDDDDNNDDSIVSIDPDVCDLSEFAPVAAAALSSMFSLASPGATNFAISISDQGEITELHGESCEMTSNGGEGCDDFSHDIYECGDCEFTVWEVDGVKKVALDSCADPGVPAGCLADFCDDSYGKVIYDISSASGGTGDDDCGGYDPCCETCSSDCEWCGTDMSCFQDCYGECNQCCHNCF
jgi:hypothetical protein